MRRRLVVTFVVLAALGTLAACGDGDAASSGASTVATRSTDEARPSAPSSTTAPDQIADDAAPDDTAPDDTAPDDTAPVGVVPSGFTTVTVTITAPDGAICTRCLWLADDARERHLGLMGVTSLGSADGMVFVYEADSTGQFWMRDTLIELSIAFIGADGAYVSEADMTPCTAAVADDCTRYGAAAPYRLAVEVPAGQLDEVGLVPGATVRIDGEGPPGCER